LKLHIQVHKVQSVIRINSDQCLKDPQRLVINIYLFTVELELCKLENPINLSRNIL